MTLLLPDLSEFQPAAYMPRIRAANGGAAIIRAAYGASHPDHVFTRLRAAAAGYSFLGIYQYVVASQDVTVQAEAFCRIVGRLGPHEVAIADVEEGGGDEDPRAVAWFAHVDKALGRLDYGQAWLYSGLDYAETHGLTPVFTGRRHTWVAAYRDAEPNLGHTLWQCTNGTTGPNRTNWPGAGFCDTSVYHGTLPQLAALIAPPARPSPAAVMTTGRESLLEFAAEHKVPAAFVLRVNAVHDGHFSPALAAYIDGGNLKAPLPKGLLLRVVA